MDSPDENRIRMQSDLEKVIVLAEEAVAPLTGVTVVDARWAMQGNKRTLEVTIHRPIDRISLDDCEHVSRSLEKLLDEANPPVADGHYLLEVQSPGLERELKTDREFAAFLGENVEVNTRQQHEVLGWSFTGRLERKDQSTITIAHPKPSFAATKGRKKAEQTGPEGDLETVVLSVEHVARVKLHPQF